MNKYQSYKDSGVEWIGEIPSHWKRIKFKYVTNLMTCGHAATPKYVDKSEGYIFLSAQNIRNEKVDFWKHNYISPELHETLTRNNKVEKGDILQVRVGGNTNIGQTAVYESDKEVSIYVSLSHIKLNEKVLSGYIKHLCNSSGYKEEATITMRIGGGVANFNVGDQERIIISLPPISEQQQIVSYLDRKTQQIDNLIQHKEQKIDLLKEKRISVINQAVTKGLVPDVVMKDSGVEWIGKIPSHWFVVKVKYVTNKVVDGTHFTPTYTDSGIPFLRVTDIQSEEINLDKVKYISSEEHAELIKRCNPERGDVLLSKNGTIGITKVVDWDWEFSIFVSLCLLKFKENFSPYLFSWFFESDVVNQQVSESSKKTSVTNLHLDKIREMKLLQPPIEEQNEIVQYLNEETKEIDELINYEEGKIQLLSEYRKSLISEVVTGKIRVCEADNSIQLKTEMA